MKEIFVVGNGASLKGFDWTYLKDKEWVGLTLAYRHWNRNKIYPNHYINIDAVVIKNNIKDIMKLIKEKRCENYILCNSVLEYCPEIKEFYNPNGESPVKFIQDLYGMSGGLSPFRYLKIILFNKLVCFYSMPPPPPPLFLITFFSRGL